MTDICRSAVIWAAAGVLFSATVAEAAPGPSRSRVCQATLSGTWVISSYSFADVSAADPGEVRRSVGKSVIVSPESIRFAGTACRVIKREDTMTNDTPGYPLSVEYTCRDGVIIPWLTVGKSCTRILAELDGATYVLKRRSPH